MGRNKLREVFSNDPNSEMAKWVKEVEEQAIREEWCSTCKNCIPVDPYLPGYVSAFPECKYGGPAINHCDKYEKQERG